MCRISKKTGLTLIEMLAVFFLFSIMLGAIWMTYNTGVKIFYSQQIRTGVKADIGKALEALSIELRQATFPNSGFVISTAGRDVNFRLDTNNDGLDETIQYIWSGTVGASLNRVTTITIPVISSVKTISFTFYDANNNELAFPVTAATTTFVTVDVTVTDKNETFQLRSNINLRNR